MNQKGLIGKIFVVIGIIILLILIIGAITAYQVNGLIKTVQAETKSIQSNVNDFQASKNCSRITNIEDSINKIKDKAESTCKNPIIRIAAEKIDKIPYKCDDLPTIGNAAENSLQPFKNFCGLNVTQ